MMSSSSKMIEKLKQGIQGLEKVSEVKKEGTDEILPYLMHDLTPALIEEARTKLKETDEIRPKALEELRELLKNEKNLITPVDDLFLLSFLRARKFNVKKAFKLIQNYWSFRNEYSHIYDTVETQPVLDMLYRNCLGFLPYRDRQGCVVVICKIGMWDPSVDTYEVLFRAATAILIHSMQLPATQVAGYRVIFDTRGLSWKQLKMCTPSNIILLIRSTQYCFPGRYKAFHVIAESKLFQIAWAIVYPLLTSKLKKRFILHGSDLSPLLDYIHPEVLPEEFGGKAGTFDNDSWKDIIDGNINKMLDMLNYGYKD